MTTKETLNLTTQYLINLPGSGTGKSLAINQGGNALEWITSGGGNYTNNAPTASNVSISGVAQKGALLTASYTYNDAESEPEGSSLKRWYIADDNADTNRTLIAGATSLTYLVQNSDVGKYIQFEVTPRALYGIQQGSATVSNYTAQIADSAIANLWIISGQSNAQGLASPYDFHTPYRNEDIADNELIWNNTAAAFQKMTVGTLSSSSNNNDDYIVNGIHTAGAEISMMKTLSQNNPSDNIYLVKYAVGATHLYANNETDWSASSTGELLDTLKARVLAAKSALEAQGQTVIIRGLLWVQGESDAWGGRTAVQYQNDLEALYQELVTDLSTPNLPIVVYQIHYMGSGGGTKDEIRAGQAAFVAVAPLYRFLVNCDVFALRDAYHLEAQGYIWLGQAAAMYLAKDGYVAPSVTSQGPAAAAPTRMLVDVDLKQVNWTPNPTYSAITDEEISLNGGKIWQAVTARPYQLPTDRDFVPDRVQVRVKQGPGRDASAAISNSIIISRNVPGHMLFYFMYGNEISENDYYSCQTLDTSLAYVASTTGLAVKFYVGSAGSYDEQIIGCEPAFGGGGRAFSLAFNGTNVVCRQSNNDVYSEAITVGWYRIMFERKSSAVKYQKSANGISGWSTFYTENNGPATNWFINLSYSQINVFKTIYDVQLDKSNKDPDLLAFYSSQGYRSYGGWLSDTFHDSSGNERHIRSSARYDFEGLNGWFNPTFDSVSATTTGFSATSNGWSFTGWINDYGAKDTIYFKKGSEYQLWYQNSVNKIYFSAYTTTDESTHTDVAVTMTQNVLHFVAVTWSAANGLKISVDNGTPVSAALSSMFMNQDTLLKFSSQSNNNSFYGKSSQWRFWGKELSASEITTFYNGGSIL